MDWSNERYVRVYTRDTVTWKLLDWQARTVLLHLFRKVDRAGVLDVGSDGPVGAAAILELPIEVVRHGLEQLTVPRTADTMPTVIATTTAYVIPNFMPAQEAPQSDAQRKRESRARRRDAVLAGHETSRMSHETSRSRDEIGQNVTFGHDQSHSVTPDPVPDPDPVPVLEPKALALTRDDAPTRKQRSPRRKARGPLPENWQPRQHELDKAVALHLDAAREATRFRDHHQARGTLNADWDAAFRTWLDKAVEFAAQRGGSTQTPRQPEPKSNLRPM